MWAKGALKVKRECVYVFVLPSKTLGSVCCVLRERVVGWWNGGLTSSLNPFRFFFLFFPFLDNRTTVGLKISRSLAFSGALKITCCCVLHDTPKCLFAIQKQRNTRTQARTQASKQASYTSAYLIWLRTMSWPAQ